MRADGDARDDVLGDRIDERDAVGEIARDGERAVRRARERDGKERQRQRDVAVDLAARGVDVRDLFLERPGDAHPHTVAVRIAQRHAERAAERDRCGSP